MNQKLKIFISLSFIIVVTWLIVSPDTNRISSLRRLISEHKIPKLKDNELKNIQSLIERLTTIAGVNQKINFDTLPPTNSQIKKELNFFVVSSEISSFTHCNKGNAIYDAQLNSIFLDISLVRPEDWMIYDPGSGIQLNQGDLPFLNTYLAFIVMHELGHYKLHGSSGGFFDFNSTKKNASFRQKEAEADQFAISGMTAYFESQKETDYYKNIGQQIDLSSQGLSKEEVAMTALVEMGNSIVLGMLYGISPYSPYFSDAAHPTYITRTKSMLKPIIERNDISALIKSKAEFVYAYLDKLDELASQHTITTITFPAPVLEANFSFDGSLIVLSTSGLEYYRIPEKKLLSAIEDKRDISVNDIASAYSIKINERFYDSSDHVRLFHSGNGNMYCLKEDELYVLNKNVFEKNSGEKTNKLFQNAHSIQVRDASDNMITFQDSCITKLESGEYTMLSKAAIRNYLTVSTGQSNLEADYYNPIFNSDKISLPVYETGNDNKKVYGLIFLDKKSLTINGYVAFHFPADLFAGNRKNEYDNNVNLILFDNDNTDNIFISRIIKKNSVIDCWKLFKFSPAGIKISESDCFPFLSQKVKNKESVKDFDPSMYKERCKFLSKNKYLVNYNNDCVFRLDLDKMEAQTVFFPGNEDLHIRSKENEQMLFFNSGFKKVFLQHKN